MTLKTTLAEILDADPGRAVADRPRSGKWPRIATAHLANNPTCAVCGGKLDLDVHHVLPFHLYPKLELDRQNLITLCRHHHFLFGHLENWSAFNPLVRADAEIWRFRLRARRTLLRLAGHQAKRRKARRTKTTKTTKTRGRSSTRSPKPCGSFK